MPKRDLPLGSPRRPPLWSDPPLAIVGHGASTRALLRVLTHCTPEEARTLQLASGGAVLLDERGAWTALAELTGDRGLEREV